MSVPATTCTSGKLSHPTEAAARRHARRVRAKGSVRAHPYRCDECHAWHVGGFFAAPPAPADAFQRPRREVPDTPRGTVHCQSCGHPSDVHAAGACLGHKGSCTCEAAQ